MEKLNVHIEKLLAYHEYVVVPQLGGFVLQKQSAEISTEKITAPRSTISFNPLMKHADGLLAIEIARTQGITFRSANELIQEEVGKIVKQLSQNKNVTFGKLGTLTGISTGGYRFEPAPNPDFLPYNLAVSDLHIAQRRSTKHDIKKQVSFTLPRISTIRNIAAAILFFGLLGISQQLNDVRKTEYADLSSIAFAAIPEVTITPDPCPELEISKEADAEIVTNAGELYHVVVASLPTKVMAQNYCEVLKSRNFICAHILEPVITYRVVIQSFVDKQQAIGFMENLRKTDNQFATAWVLCKQ